MQVSFESYFTCVQLKCECECEYSYVNENLTYHNDVRPTFSHFIFDSCSFIWNRILLHYYCYYYLLQSPFDVYRCKYFINVRCVCGCVFTILVWNLYSYWISFRLYDSKKLIYIYQNWMHSLIIWIMSAPTVFTTVRYVCVSNRLEICDWKLTD